MSNMTVVPPEGKTGAKIALVGEAPGREEERERRPFVGTSGRLLMDMLIRVGLTREMVYLTNVCKIRPEGNNFGAFYEDKSRKTPTPFLSSSIEALKQEPGVLKANVVVALGGEALRSLTGKRGIEKWRGSILESCVGKVVATYHPAYISRVYKHRGIGELDLKRAVEESGSPNLHLPTHSFTINPTYDDVMDYLRTKRERLSFDLETTRGGHIRCVGLSHHPSLAISIPFMSSESAVRVNGKTLLTIHPGGGMGSHWGENEELLILKELKRVMEDESVGKIAQNFPFDATMLMKEFGIRVKGPIFDTMVAQHTCYSELPKSLDFLTSVYTRVPRYSDYDPSSDRATWTYNCYDSAVTFEIAPKLEEEMRELGVLDFFYSHAMPTMFALARASNRGIHVNHELREKLAQKTEREIEEIKGKIKGVLGYELNPDSSKQVREYVYDKLGLPKQYHRITKRVTADEVALERLMEKHPVHRENLQLILDYRGKTTLLGTFLRSGLDERGKMVTSYNATGTVNGRISSSKTIFGLGGNLQNIPRGSFRRMYIAPEGKIFVKSDLRQAESMGVAWFAKIRWMIEAYLAGESWSELGRFDIHRWNASNIYSIPEGKVDKETRRKAGQVTHGANYGVGPRTSMRQSKATYLEAKHGLETYKKALPDLPLWWKEVENTVQATRRLRSPLGRQRIFFGRMDNALFRSAYAFKPQSTIGDIINRAFYILDRDLPRGAYPILQVHDEIDCEVPLDRSIFEESIALIKGAMEYTVLIEGVPEPLTIPTDISVGPNWCDLTPLSEWRPPWQKK